MIFTPIIGLSVLLHLLAVALHLVGVFVDFLFSKMGYHKND